MTTHEDFFSNIDGALSPEQAAQALALAESGDTGAVPETGGAPATTPAEDNPAKGEQAQASDQAGSAPADKAAAGAADNAAAAEIDPANAVVLARDGKHTIPYERLEEARQGAQRWKEQAEAAQRELTDLKAQAQARVDAGQAPTKTDNMVAQAEAAIEAGADPGVFGDFSEQALAAGIARLVAQQVQQQVASHVNKALEPLQAKHQQSEAASHYETIYSAHPNADSIAQSAEFKAWVDSHPSVVRDAYMQLLFDPSKGGSAAQIVEVLDAFTKATAKEVPHPPAASAEDAAKAAAAAAAAKPQPPSSLTSIPGGRADGLSPQERMADMGAVDLYQAMETMTPAQIEAFLNKQM